MEPEIGARVVIKPRNGLDVQYEEVHGRWLPQEGQAVVWNVWWHRRYRDGSIEIVSEEEQD
jgi:hypothetical protein